MAKIETVVLKEMEVIETENGYEQIFSNERKFPAAITNYSLSMGEKTGLIKSSQLNDLVDIQKVFEAAINPDANKEEALKGIDTSRYLKVIYLAIVGVNPKLSLTYDEFTELYHEDVPQIIETYTNLVLATMPIVNNAFAEGFQKSTKKK